MFQSLIKWIAAGASAGLAALLAYVTGHAPVGVDMIVALVALAVVNKLVGFLVGKLPVPEP